MKYIFIDESGDLGFKKTSSRWFLFTIVITEDGRSLEHIIKKIWKKLNKRYKKTGELHAYHEKDNIRKRVLKAINKAHKLTIICCPVNKVNIPSDLVDDKQSLYNQILVNSLEYVCKTGLINNNEQIYIIIDRMYTKKESLNMLKTLIQNILNLNKFISNSILFHSSHEDKSLQVVDFISWAFFNKIERNTNDFIEILKNQTIDIHEILIKRKLPR